MSNLIIRARNLANQFGQMFGGRRDLYSVYGYKQRVEYIDRVRKYVRQDIGARIVEAEPAAVWSRPPALERNGETKVPEEFTKKWRVLVEDHNLYQTLYNLDKLCGLGRYSVLLIGFNDGKDLSEPLTPSSDREVIYLQPWSEDAAEIESLQQSPQDPRFGLPELYKINPNKGDSEVRGDVKKLYAQGGFTVHHSRILHIAENTLEDEIYGVPRLDRVYNLLDDLIKLSGGSAETYWLASNRGMQVDVDKEMDLQPEDAAALEEQAEEYMHNLTRIMKTRGVKINSLGSDVADPRGPFQVTTALISGATGIPQRILFGSEAGQLASEQDRANWASRIEERRSIFAEPTVLNRFAKKLIDSGVLPEIDSFRDIWLWPDAFIQNPLEISQTRAQNARSLANVSKSLSDDVPVVTQEEGRNMIGFQGPGPAPNVDPGASDADNSNTSNTNGPGSADNAADGATNPAGEPSAPSESQTND